MDSVSLLFCKDKKKVKSIYEEAFPPQERMPFGLMMAMGALPSTEFKAYYDGDRLCGLIYYGKMLRHAFIMFFAVDNELRGNGYGAQILEDLETRLAKKQIIVTIEPPVGDERDIRDRRKNFYLRNGFSDTGYNIKLSGVEQEILICGGEFSRAAFSLFLIAYGCFAIWPNIWKRGN